MQNLNRTTPVVTRWLALHPRFHVHYAPTYASWLNQVEIWFNIKNKDVLRKCSNKRIETGSERVLRSIVVT